MPNKLSQLWNWVKLSSWVTYSYLKDAKIIGVNDNVRLHNDPNEWQVISVEEKYVFIRRIGTQETRTVFLSDLTKI